MAGMTNWRIQEQANIEKYQKLGQLNQSQIIKVGNKAAHRFHRGNNIY